MQGNGLKNRAKLVKAVRTLSQNFQPQINFRKGWNLYFRHRAYFGCAAFGDDFCATRCFDWLTFFSTSAILSVSKSAGSTRPHSSSAFSPFSASRSPPPPLPLPPPP